MPAKTLQIHKKSKTGEFSYTIKYNVRYSKSHGEGCGVPVRHD